MKKTDKEILKSYVETAWDSDSMVNYFLKETSEFVILDNDTILNLEKKSIKTKFCFGYSLSRYDTESYDNANKLEDNARKDVEFFINENKSKLFEKSEKYVAFQNYGKGKMFYYVPLETYEIDIAKGENYKYNSEPYYLSDKENEKLNNAIDKANESFMKRVATYLKKYGLSKIDTWTYWRDE